MGDKEKLKSNYNKIIENLQKRLDKTKKDKELYRKLKIILAIISMLLLSFGLWPVAIVGFISTILCHLKEDKKSKSYNNTINKLEDSFFALQDLEEQEVEKQEVKEETKTNIQEDHPIIDVLYGEKDDNKVYRR